MVGRSAISRRSLPKENRSSSILHKRDLVQRTDSSTSVPDMSLDIYFERFGDRLEQRVAFSCFLEVSAPEPIRGTAPKHRFLGV